VRPWTLTWRRSTPTASPENQPERSASALRPVAKRSKAPHRLEYLWHLRFDRSDATEVAITFAEAGEATTVSIVHRGWERLGAAGPERRERNRRGWAGAIEHYRDACAASPG
jgi:uncharacterized protein YndB with AHSA1/START domain